jgi:hypothetical protein
VSRELAAIVRFERASRAVTAATKAIADSISRCSVAEAEIADGHGNKYRDSKNRLKTHLWQLLNSQVEYCEDTGAPNYLSPEEFREELESMQCPHCIETFRLIQERKAARKDLGIAKRALRSIGRAAIAKEGQGVEG